MTIRFTEGFDHILTPSINRNESFIFCFEKHKESIFRKIVEGFWHGGDRSSHVCFGFDNSRNPERLNLCIFLCSLCTHFHWLHRCLTLRLKVFERFRKQLESSLQMYRSSFLVKHFNCLFLLCFFFVFFCSGLLFNMFFFSYRTGQWPWSRRESETESISSLESKDPPCRLSASDSLQRYTYLPTPSYVHTKKNLYSVWCWLSESPFAYS